MDKVEREALAEVFWEGADLSLTVKAAAVAKIAHRGQFRRDGVTPYFTHPEEVAKHVIDRLKPIAYLHDVMEDCGVTTSDLRALGFPAYVIRAVDVLTRKGESYDDYMERLLKCRDAIPVKIADMRHNLSCAPSNNSKAKIAKWLPVLQAALTPPQKAEKE